MSCAIFIQNNNKHKMSMPAHAIMSSVRTTTSEDIIAYAIVSARTRLHICKSVRTDGQYCMADLTPVFNSR